MGTFLYNYTLTTMGYQQNVLQGEIKLATDKAQERLNVIAILWGDSGNELNLTVFNFGKCDIKIVDVYVNGERVTSYLSGRGEKINIHKIMRVSFISPVLISPETLYEIIIITERGVPHVYRSES
jgi:hypothetical protein